MQRKQTPVLSVSNYLEKAGSNYLETGSNYLEKAGSNYLETVSNYLKTGNYGMEQKKKNVFGKLK
jgi:hypothetical protein